MEVSCSYQCFNPDLWHLNLHFFLQYLLFYHPMFSFMESSGTHSGFFSGISLEASCRRYWCNPDLWHVNLLFYVSAMFYYILKHSPLSLACLQSWWNPAIDLQSPVGKAIDRLSFQHRSTGFPSFRLLLQCFPDICIRFLAGLRWFLLVLLRCVLPSNPLALLPSTLHRPILVKNMTPKLWEQKGWLACLPAIPPAPEESRPHHLPWQLWDPPLSIQDISKYLKFEAHIRLAKRKVAQAVLWGRQWQILLLAVLHRAAEGPQLLWTIRRVPVPSEWKGLRPPQHEMISHPPHEIM